MIRRKDISDFFELEAKAAKTRWEALMKLPIKERIRKRKAISPVLLEKELDECSEENNYLFKVRVEKNLSDFKEGEYIILHKKESTSGIKCTINRFEDDSTIILEVFSRNLPSDLKTYYNIPLCLDKDLVDLRESVFDNFLVKLPIANKFWNKLIINTKQVPIFKEKTDIEDELEDTIKNFKLNLLPRQREAIINCMAAEDYYLVQGPPGTGKSFVLSFIILEEIAYFNHKVIVIGPNHMAINNTLNQVAKNCTAYIDLLNKVGRSYNAPDFKVIQNDEEVTIYNYTRINSWAANQTKVPWVIGLTPHSLYTSRAKDLECDTLIIDEAGQMTIPLALMGMIKAKKVIFAGDYKQLPPIVSSEEIHDEMKQSVFQSLITDENCTMLDVSFRMCEPICNFVSELFYDGELKPMKLGCGNAVINSNPLYSFDSPVIIHHIGDCGEQTSDKEAEFIVKMVEGYLKYGLPASEIAVLSPFRAQAANIRRFIRKNECINEEEGKIIAVDTIDKMQGQEREVIIFSLVAGDLEYMTEMADFLYNPNKLNVAFSRAKSKLIIVGNIDKLRLMDFAMFPHLKRMLGSQYVKLV